MTIYSLDVLLFLFGTSQLFQIQFQLLLPDLHTDFSRGRSDGLVFPSLSEFSTVYCCDPHSQRLWLCGLPQTVENSEKHGITRPSDLPLGKSVCRSGTRVRTGHGTDWFQIGKGVHQGCILSPCLFNLYVEYIMRNAGLDEAQTESGLTGEISITSDMQITPPLWQKVKKN